MSDSKNWRAGMRPDVEAKIDELLKGDGASEAEIIDFFDAREKAEEAHFSKQQKKEEEASNEERADGEKDAEGANAEYEAEIARLAALQDVSMRASQREATDAAGRFKTTKAAIDADVRRWRKAHKPEPESEEVRQSQLQRLVSLGRSQTLWHDGNGSGYASVLDGGHFEHHPVISRSFLDWLRRSYSRKHAVKIEHEWVPQMPGTNALKEAIQALEGYALDSGVVGQTGFRVLCRPGAVFLDLGRPDWWVAKVTGEGVEIVANPGMFRPRGQHPLPIPGTSAGRGIADLRRLVNVRDEDFVLVVGYLLGTLFPGPYPVLINTGGEGSGKTMLSRVIKRTVDPDATDLRSPPRNVEDLMVAARHSRLVGYDNVSFITLEVSDAMCRVSGGGTMTKRANYTDGDEFAMTACRPMLLNGIPDKLATRPDLMDRMILIKAPLLTERKTEDAFWSEFRAAHTFVLGDLLRGVSGALRDANSIKVKDEVRLIGWVKWAEAGCRALGFEPDEFIDAYMANRELAGGAALEDNVVAQGIIMLMDRQRYFKGTASELRAEIEQLVRARADLKDEKLPKANQLSSVLRRFARVLRYEDVEMVFDQPLSRGNRRGIVIRKLPSKAADELLRTKVRDIHPED